MGRKSELKNESGFIYITKCSIHTHIARPDMLRWVRAGSPNDVCSQVEDDFATLGFRSSRANSVYKAGERHDSSAIK